MLNKINMFKNITLNQNNKNSDFTNHKFFKEPKDSFTMNFKSRHFLPEGFDEKKALPILLELFFQKRGDCGKKEMLEAIVDFERNDGSLDGFLHRVTQYHPEQYYTVAQRLFELAKGIEEIGKCSGPAIDKPKLGFKHEPNQYAGKFFDKAIENLEANEQDNQDATLLFNMKQHRDEFLARIRKHCSPPQ